MFIKPDGSVFDVDVILDFGCLVLEHADNMEDAELLLLEDGDRFYPENYENTDALFSAMCEENDILSFSKDSTLISYRSFA